MSIYRLFCVVDKTFSPGVICDYSDMLMVIVYLPTISNSSEKFYVILGGLL